MNIKKTVQDELKKRKAYKVLSSYGVSNLAIDLTISEKDKEIKEILERNLNHGIGIDIDGKTYDLVDRDKRQSLLKEVEKIENPYPKDIFRWDNKEKLNFNRGRFNRQCFEIVENMREDVLRILKKTKEMI